MKKSITVIIFLLLSQCVVIAQVKDTSLNGFRTVRIRNGKKIKLQSNIELLKDVTIKGSNDNYKFKKGAIGGADSMDVDVNKSNQIIAITAHYENHDTIYAYEKGNYNRLFKTGKEHQFISKNLSIKVTKWEDDLTIFELIQVTYDYKNIPCPENCDPSKETYSVIFDKEFYHNKMKQCIDLKKNDNSIEILKRLGLI